MLLQRWLLQLARPPEAQGTTMAEKVPAPKIEPVLGWQSFSVLEQ